MSAVAAAPVGAGSYPAEVVRLTNQQRLENHCRVTLTTQPNLAAAAQGHSADMAANNYFDHDSPDGTTPWTRMQRAGYTGYTSAGENIAAGQPTPAAVVAAWMNSPGHRANMLNCSFNQVGIGYARSSGGPAYWTMDLAQR